VLQECAQSHLTVGTIHDQVGETILHVIVCMLHAFVCICEYIVVFVLVSCVYRLAHLEQLAADVCPTSIEIMVVHIDDRLRETVVLQECCSVLQ
jgi:hypothetical protein